MTAVLPRDVENQLVHRAQTTTSPEELDALAIEHGLMPRELVDILKRHQADPHVRQRQQVLARTADIPNGGTFTPPTPPRQETPVQAVDAPTRDHLATLLHQAEESSSTRIRNLGAKINVLLNDLRAQIEADREQDAARKEIERLEAQLRSAKAKLTSRSTTTRTTTTPNTDGPSSTEIRSWASNAGVDCPQFGRIPQRVRDAYTAAHTDTAA